MSIVFGIAEIVAGGVVIFMISLLLTKGMCHYALKNKLLDVPNNRSSHTVPTPWGGGLAIAAGLLGGIASLGYFNIIPMPFVWAILGGGAIIVAVGILDDRYSIPAQYRIVVHCIAALWALRILGGLPEIHIGGEAISLGTVGSILGLLWIVGMSNAYNFMDGIDGLAASEAVFVGFFGGLMLVMFGAQSWGFVAFIVAASSAGFLMWNWHPAKIFMGDGGSVLLGYCFAVLAIATEQFAEFPLFIWTLLLAVFIVDAFLSTLRRIIMGERWFEAHHTFAYQRLVEMGYSHAQVARWIGLINIILVLFSMVTLWRPIVFFPVLLLTFGGLSLVWLSVQHNTQGPSKSSLV